MKKWKEQIHYSNTKVQLFGVSVKGSLHEQEQKPNQDAFAYKAGKEWLVMTVADGLGSREKSEEGAQYAVTSFIDFIEPYLNYRTFFMQEEYLLQFAKQWQQHFSPNEMLYDTTLQFIIHHQSTLYMGSIGDGLIILNGKSFILHEREQNSYSNRTDSLNGAKRAFLSTYEMNEHKMLALIATDGISEDLHVEKLPELCCFMQGQIEQTGEAFLTELANWVEHWETPMHTDDRTIAILYIERERFN